MIKLIYALIALVMVSSPAFANREIATKTDPKANSKPLSFAERKAALKKWEATPDGILFKKWEASTAGKKYIEMLLKFENQLRSLPIWKEL